MHSQHAIIQHFRYPSGADPPLVPVAYNLHPQKFFTQKKKDDAFASPQEYNPSIPND
ncbi:MAG: hypothetical protein AAFY72_15835 [Cyanobacteria bacterium J06649_4]